MIISEFLFDVQLINGHGISYTLRTKKLPQSKKVWQIFKIISFGIYSQVGHFMCGK